MIWISTAEEDVDIASLTDSENEESAFIAEPEIPPMAGTRSGKQFLRKYDEAEVSSSKPVEKVAEQPPKK